MNETLLQDQHGAHLNMSFLSSGISNFSNAFDSNTSFILPRRSQLEITINAFFLMTIIIIALSGNIAVIYAILTTPKLREHSSNLFIINLSVTDMSSALVVMCTAFVMLVGDYQHINQVWCDICCAANYIFIIVSMLTLAFISIDRYFAVIHPLTYITRITKQRVLVMITWAWFQGFIFGFAPVIKHWVHYDYWEVVCAIAWHDEKPQSIYYVVSAFIICFALPGVIMLLCYSSIIQEAKKCKTSPASAAVPKGQRSATKTIRSLLIVVALFFICMTPFCVTKLLKVIFSDPMYVPPYANLVSAYMGYMSSVINPFIYGIFRADFRAAYKNLWWRMSCKYFGRQPNPPPPPSSFATNYPNRERNSIFTVTGKQSSPTAKRQKSPPRRSISPSPITATSQDNAIEKLSLSDHTMKSSPEQLPVNKVLESKSSIGHCSSDQLLNYSQLPNNSQTNPCYIADPDEQSPSTKCMANIDV